MLLAEVPGSGRDAKARARNQWIAFHCAKACGAPEQYLDEVVRLGQDVLHEDRAGRFVEITPELGKDLRRREYEMLRAEFEA